MHDDIEVTALDMTVRGLFDITWEGRTAERGAQIVLHTRAATIRFDAGEYMAAARDFVADNREQVAP